jgi:glyoxylase-like metal-dependent hydrolase (beta-lactamase superfamily II)
MYSMSHTFHQVSPHIHWLSPDSTTDRPVLGVISGTCGSLVVDAGNSPAHARILLKDIERCNLPAPSYLFLTHWHWDHVFGAARFSLPTFAHYETARIVERMSQFDWSDAALDQRVKDGLEIEFCRDMLKAELPNRSSLAIRPPEIAISEQVNVHLGDITCQLIHMGGDHAHDSTVAFVPEDKVMFLGDCIYDDLHHGPRRLTSAKLLPLYERLLSYSADYYLPSHHSEPMTRQALAEEYALMTKIGQTVERLGDNRESILATLPQVLERPLEIDDIDIADAFLGGLRLPEVESVL